MAPRPPDNEWSYRIESELSKIKTIIEERTLRRDRWEQDCSAKFAEIERRVGLVELLCKGSSDTSTPMGKVMALSRDPAALIIVFLVVSMLIEAGLSPATIRAFFG